MAVIPLTKDNFEVFTIEGRPTRTFSSGSNGITGSVNPFGKNSSIERKTVLDQSQGWNEKQLEITLDKISKNVKNNPSNKNISPGIHDYLNLIKNTAPTIRATKNINVERQQFYPSLEQSALDRFSNILTASIKNSHIKNTLLPYYRVENSDGNYAYTNYNSLNFFTASNVPSNTALIYPNYLDSDDWLTSKHRGAMGYVSGSYNLQRDFTFEFYINPKYTPDNPTIGPDLVEYKPGTILHLSSSYAISLVSGSSVDKNGTVDKFRVLFQCTQSADIPPDRFAFSSTSNKPTNATIPRDFAFISNDNVLNNNNWHHVVIRWPGIVGSGSFVIDGVQQGSFVIPRITGSINPRTASILSADQEQPSVLCIGNYLESSDNQDPDNWFSKFFTEKVSSTEGLFQMNNHATETEPNNYNANYPLNAEIHDLKIYNQFRTLNQLYSSSLEGTSDLDNILFYLPPFFTKESPTRENIMLSLHEQNGSSNPFSLTEPINPFIHATVAAHDISLENYCRDFSTNRYPRLLHLSASTVDRNHIYNFQELTSNEFLYNQQSHHPATEVARSKMMLKRNMTIMPCDNGLFRPNFELLISGSKDSFKTGSMSKFVDDLGTLNLSLISLKNILSTSQTDPTRCTYLAEHDKLLGMFVNATNDPNFRHKLRGSTVGAGAKAEEQLNSNVGKILSLYQLTNDPNFNGTVIFDTSDIFYGNSISKNTLTLRNSNYFYLTGSDFGLTIKDNGHGNLYRADSLTPHAKWNSLGTVLYNEGLIQLVSPHVTFFGENNYTITFDGEHNVHVLRINSIAQSGMLNSSSNPSYMNVPASNSVNDRDESFVYITGINFHDENLNVVAKAQLAQPILKQTADSYLIKTKIDF